MINKSIIQYSIHKLSNKLFNNDILMKKFTLLQSYHHFTISNTTVDSSNNGYKSYIKTKLLCRTMTFKSNDNQTTDTTQERQNTSFDNHMWTLQHEDIEKLKVLLPEISKDSISVKKAISFIQCLKTSGNKQYVAFIVKKIRSLELRKLDTLSILLPHLKDFPESHEIILSIIKRAQNVGVRLPADCLVAIYSSFTQSIANIQCSDSYKESLEFNVKLLLKDLLLSDNITPLHSIPSSRTLDLSNITPILQYDKTLIRDILEKFMDGVYDQIIQANLQSIPPDVLMSRDLIVLKDLELHKQPMLGISSLVIIIGSTREKENLDLAAIISKLLRDNYNIPCFEVLEEKIMFEMGNRFNIPPETYQYMNIDKVRDSFVKYLYGSKNKYIPTVLHIRPKSNLSYIIKRLTTNAGKDISALNFLVEKVPFLWNTTESIDSIDTSKQNETNDNILTNSNQDHNQDTTERRNTIRIVQNKGFDDETMKLFRRLAEHEKQNDAKQIAQKVITQAATRTKPKNPVRSPGWK